MITTKIFLIHSLVLYINQAESLTYTFGKLGFLQAATQTCPLAFYVTKKNIVNLKYF